MKKAFLSLFTFLMLTGCSIIQPSTDPSGDPVEPGPGPIIPDPDPSDDEPGIIDDEGRKILSIKIRDGDNLSGKGDIEVGNNKYRYLTVDFTSVEGVTLDLDAGDYDVIWSSSDESVATVSKTGKIIGLKEGVATIHCETVVDHCTDRFLLNVYSSSSKVRYEWQRIDGEDVSAGDIIVLACPEEGVSATNEITGKYLHPVNSTFSSDYSKITTLGNNTAQFMVGNGKNGGYTLENEEGYYLAATNDKKVAFVKNIGNIEWTFEDYAQGICMESTSNVGGWFMYNGPADRFTIYQDDPSNKMFFVSIYRLTGIRY